MPILSAGYPMEGLFQCPREKHRLFCYPSRSSCQFVVTKEVGGKCKIDRLFLVEAFGILFAKGLACLISTKIKRNIINN